MIENPNFYLIKDLSRLSGHSIYTLKFYLKLGLIRESGRSPETQFRCFDDATVAQLARIRSLRKEQKSLAEIGRLLPPPVATTIIDPTGRAPGGGISSPAFGQQADPHPTHG